MNSGMFISPRWRSRWRIPGRWWFRGASPKGDCTTNQNVPAQKRPVRAQKLSCSHAKTPLFSCESSLFREMKLAVFCPGAAVARPPRPISGAGRRHGGAAAATPAGGCENSWPKSYSVLCLFLGAIPWESVMSHRLTLLRPSPSAMGRAGCSAHPSLALREARFADSSPHEAWVRTRAGSCSNPLKTLKTAMGRSCNKLA